MVHTLSLLKHYSALYGKDSKQVNLPTGSQVPISHAGESSVLGDKTVTDVLFLPDFKYNLLSASQLTKGLKYGVLFFPDFFIFQEIYIGKVLGIGKEEHGLYLLQSDASYTLTAEPELTSLLSLSGSSSPMNSCDSSSSATSNDCVASLWHKRLGHAPILVIRRIAGLHNVKVQDHHCSVCPIAKQSRLSFPTSISTSCCSFDLIHADVWGPYRVATHDDKRYFLTLVDDFSRYTWIFLLTSKANCIVPLRDFILMVKNQFGRGVKCFRTDNGTEFFNAQVNALFTQHGVLHQSFCVYTPQQNGVVERRHRYILDMARALRFQAFIPLKF